MKKIILLFVLVAGLTSCSNDSQDETTPEVTYADVKPTQTKYKAYYGEKLVKLGSIASKNTETSPGSEMFKPVSVIYYPRTNTISFSNIFDNTTVEYPVTSTVTNEISIVYSFKINGATFTCTITIKDNKAIKIVIVYGNATYTFDITIADSKKLAKLLVSDIRTSPNAASNSTREYFYSDTLVNSSVYRYKDPNTLEDLVRYTEYKYEGAKLIGTDRVDEDGTILSSVLYTYENNLIVKATNKSAEGTITSVTLYEYDSNKRISAVKFANVNLVVNFARYYTYPKKNTMNVVYKGKNDVLEETEVCTYDDQRKIFLVTQDQILEPFLYLPITHAVSTTPEGEEYSYPDISYEYSADGYLIKTVSENDIQNLEYREE
ncbi:MAG: hypothetical protein EOO44_01625 [Flavobacterium sp.]|nr:MAG: hypothetical protein EOO44_01625 [Flavobacterium sp.]